MVEISKCFNVLMGLVEGVVDVVDVVDVVEEERELLRSISNSAIFFFFLKVVGYRSHSAWKIRPFIH